MSNKIHAQYANLPPSVEQSEVLASKFAAEASKMNTDDDIEEIVHIMEDWDKHLKSEGLIISNKAIEVFSELTKVCVDAGKQELSGRFAVIIVEVLQGIAKQYMASSLIIEKLDAVAGTLFVEVDEFKKANVVLAKLLPKPKANPRKRSVHTIVDPGSSSQGPNLNTKSTAEETPGSLKQDHNKEKAKIDAPDIDMETTQGEIDPKSAIAKHMRESYRAHYNCPEFASLPPEKQVAAIEYHMTHILGIAPTIWETQPAMYHMISDLIDKERLMKMMRDMKLNAVTEDDIADAVDEMVDAINVCHTAYGDFVSIATISNGRTKLHIAE